MNCTILDNQKNCYKLFKSMSEALRAWWGVEEGIARERVWAKSALGVPDHDATASTSSIGSSRRRRGSSPGCGLHRPHQMWCLLKQDLHLDLEVNNDVIVAWYLPVTLYTYYLI